MKKPVLTIIILIFAMMNLFGQNEKGGNLPDFNFPKDVIKNAETQLKKALADADGEATVDALVRFSLAKSSLSEETFDEVRTKIDEVLAKEKREDYRAILLYLLSEIYRTHDDNAEADSCLALIFDNDKPLKAYKIENYQKIIKSDALGRRLCPTLRDFLRYKHFGTSHIIDNLEEGEMQGFKLSRLYLYDNNEKAAYDELKAYAEKYPKSPWINDVKNRIYSIEAQKATADYPSQWHSTMPIKIEVASHNAKDVDIVIYRFPSTYEKYKRVAFKSMKKVAAKSLTFESDTIIFDKTQDVVFDPLPEGNYYVDVVVKGKSNLGEYIYPNNVLEVCNSAKYTIDNPSVQDSVRNIYVDIKTGEFLREDKSKRFGFRPHDYTSLGDLKIFTDLGIYRPGETLRYTLIYKEKTREARRAWADKTFRIEFRDTQGKEIASDTLTTDKFGQIAGEFLIPTDCQNGRFSLYAQNITIGDKDKQTSTSIGVTVSEYKTPTFYIDLTENPRAFEADKDVTLKGKALSYSGIPLANTEVKIEVSRRHLWWRYWDDEDSFEPLSLTTTTNEKGEFSLKITKEQINTTFGYFKASFMVTDEAGESQEARTDFYVGSKRSLVYNGDKDFINDKPLTLPVSLMSSDPDDKSATFEYAIYDSKKVLMKRGTLTTDTPLLDLRDLKSGTYFFEAGFEIKADGEKSDKEDIFEEIVLYRPNDKTCPKESPLWIPSCGKWVDDKGVAHVTIGTAFETHIHYVANSRLGFVKDGWLDYKPGMHEFTIPVPAGDDQFISLSFHTYRECKLYTEDAKLIYQPSVNKLTLSLSSFRDKIVPGGRETWTFTLIDRNGKPVDGRLALEVISEAVNQIQPNSWNYQSDYIYTYAASVTLNYINRRYSFGNWQEKSRRGAQYQLPELNLYDRYFFWRSGKFGHRNMVFSMADGALAEDDGVLREYVMVKGYSAASRSMKQAQVMDLAAAPAPMEDAEECEVEGVVALATGASAEEDIYNNVRASETKVALWKPMVNVGENGEVSVEFEVPSDNTTWRLNAFAFNSATESNALSQTMIAQRRVMVKPSLPRFLRSGDKTTLMANVMNSSDEEVSAKITLITFDPRTNKFIDQKTLTETIPANGMKAVGIEAEALDNLSHLGFRVIAEEICGDASFEEGKTLASDGEQQMIPVLPAVTRVVETVPFYLNPNEGDSIIDFSHLLSLNNNVKPEDVEITFEYCNNPVWYCISALPTIYDADIKTATGLAHNLFAVSLAKYLSDKNPLIAEALNKMQENAKTEGKTDAAIPFDEAALEKIIKSLSDLQNPDGGISWFDWERRESSEYVTYQVLELIGELNKIFSTNNYQLPTLNSQFIKDALKYYEKKQLENLAEMKKYSKKINYTSFEPYLYLRTLYPTAEYSLPSENASLLKKTLEACEKDWREFSLPSRGFLALSLFRNGKEKTARTIIESLRQFAMKDARRGMFWDNLQSFGFRWFSRTAITALMLEAFDEVDAGNKAISAKEHLQEIDEIRKWILLEKQTTDWGNSSMAAEATYALISTGSQWLNSAESEYSKTIIENREPITVKHEKGAPAWGAVYAKFPTEISKAKAFKLNEISITKELFKHDGGKVKSAKDIKVGDKIQVQLTIKTDRDMQYVTIRDNRAACFEPVDKKSGYRYSESNVKNRQSIGYYLDTKDTESRIMVNFLPKGEHVITYDVYVTNHGTFCTGIADVTCEYAPQFTAHTGGAISSVSQ